VKSYHLFILPRPSADCPHHGGKGAVIVFKEFIAIVKSFFMKAGILSALAFLLLYRLGEAQLLKMCAPFLMDSREIGGLGLTEEKVGMVYGTSGTIMMIIGGIAGGMLIARFGLKRCLWPMVFAIHVPDLLYVYLAYLKPESLFFIGSIVAVELFGYGLGFTAYTMFMVYFAEGEYKTAHFAIMTGLMAMGMMVPGMFSGDIQNKLGYLGFFIWVCFATIPSFLAVFFVKVRR
jgi:PAT family beta-lactamase induction signal transducer AmpG